MLPLVYFRRLEPASHLLHAIIKCSDIANFRMSMLLLLAALAVQQLHECLRGWTYFFNIVSVRLLLSF